MSRLLPPEGAPEGSVWLLHWGNDAGGEAAVGRWFVDHWTLDGLPCTPESLAASGWRLDDPLGAAAAIRLLEQALPAGARMRLVRAEPVNRIFVELRRAHGRIGVTEWEGFAEAAGESFLKAAQDLVRTAISRQGRTP